MGRGTSTTAVWISMAGAALALALAGCGTKAKPADQSAVQAKAAPAEPEGPVILTTIGQELDDKPLTDVRARHGHFQLKMVDGIATLFVDGKTVNDGNAYTPTPIQANVSIDLLGVLELPKESVAWVAVGGGTACAVSNYLIAAQGGQYPRVISVDGCGEGGTLVRKGDKIVFEIGGIGGSYSNGQLQLDRSPYDNAG